MIVVRVRVSLNQFGNWRRRRNPHTHTVWSLTMKLNISERNTNNFKINKPVLLGTYRTDHQSSPISNDKLNELYLRYRPRSLQRSIDLENGFNDHSKSKRFAVVNKFECLLEWLKVNQHLLQDQTTNSTATGKLNKLNTDFVASNGVLAFLLKSPYDSGNFFELLAERYNGTIYLKMKKKVSFVLLFETHHSDCNRFLISLWVRTLLQSNLYHFSNQIALTLI